MNLSPIIDRMIAAGLSPGEAGSIAAEIYAAGVASASVRSPGAERTRRWRHKASQNVTERHKDETSPNVTEHHKTSQCDVSTVSYRDTNIKKDKRQNSERASRGSRIDPSWAPNQADWQIASSEGFSKAEIEREALRFRDYWVGRAGAGGVKLDWAATWRNWVRTSGEKLGKTPSPSAKAQSEDVDWDTVLKTYKTIGHWSKWAGPDLSSPACRAPPEMLEKYGLTIGVAEQAPRMRAMQ